VRVSRKGGSGTVGAVTNSAVTARARTRRRAAGELTGRAERDARIAAAAAQVSAARDAIRGNAERRSLAVAAAQEAIDIAERAERDANAAADEQILRPGEQIAGQAAAALARRHRQVALPPAGDRDVSRADGRDRVGRVQAVQAEASDIASDATRPHLPGPSRRGG